MPGVERVHRAVECDASSRSWKGRSLRKRFQRIKERLFRRPKLYLPYFRIASYRREAPARRWKTGRYALGQAGGAVNRPRPHGGYLATISALPARSCEGDGNHRQRLTTIGRPAPQGSQRFPQIACQFPHCRFVPPIPHPLPLFLSLDEAGPSQD